MSQIKLVDSQLLQQTLTGSTLPVLVDFFATWCPPCRMLAPVLDELALQFAGKAEFLKVNIDEEPQLAEQFRVEVVPTLVLVQDGKIIHHAAGVPNRQLLVTLLIRATNQTAKP